MAGKPMVSQAVTKDFNRADRGTAVLQRATAKTLRKRRPVEAKEKDEQAGPERLEKE
jgi:hypothetical protein